MKKYSKNSQKEDKNVDDDEKRGDYVLNDNIENVDTPTSQSEEGIDK